MTKRENTDFNSLEDVFSEKPPKTYTEEELLNIARNPDLLDEKGEGEQVIIVVTIARQMQASEDFKRKVLEEIEKSRKKSP